MLYCYVAAWWLSWNSELVISFAENAPADKKIDSG